LAELSRETRTLVQQELQLAKAELAEKASKIGKGAGLIVGGGLIAYGGLLAIIAGLVLILIASGFRLGERRSWEAGSWQAAATCSFALGSPL
jgi:hypothetical protein